jgi:hypothetical protein
MAFLEWLSKYRLFWGTLALRRLREREINPSFIRLTKLGQEIKIGS